MIMKANKQIGFIYKDNESIDKILKDGDVVFERGFLRERTSTTLPITFGGIGKDLKDYKVYGNTVQNGEPTPDSPIEIKSCGDKSKNLLNNDLLLQTENYNTYNPTTKKWSTSTASGYGRSFFYNATGYTSRNKDKLLQLTETGTYSLKLLDAINESTYGNYLGVLLVDDNGNVISNTPTEDFISFTITEPCYLDLCRRNNAGYISFSNILLVKGEYTTDTIPDYEPYYEGYKIPVNVNGNITNIYLDKPLRKIDEYSDYIDFINGKVVRKIGEVILDGSETDWNLQNGCFTKNISDILRTPSYADRNQILVYSDYFKAGLSNYRDTIKNTNYQIAKVIDSGGKQIAFVYSDFTTINDFKIWLSTRNTMVDYVLATPTEEDIELPNIPTIDGNNILNIETEITPSQVYIKYKSNT